MNLHTELVTTEWFDPTAIRLPGYSVGRVSYGNGRSYLRLMDGEIVEPFRLYTSLTTAINTCSPMERGLLEWWCKLGLDEAGRQLKLSQHYGTLMHIAIGTFLKSKAINLDEVDEMVTEYLSSKDYWQPECSEWGDTLRHDLLAFAQFATEVNLSPLGLEYVLLSERYGFGTLIDLVCDMDVERKGFFGEVYKSGANAGQPKETKRAERVRAIINFKSGRKGFWRSNGIQAMAEQLLWEENFQDMPLQGCFNWAPTDWITSPSYKLKDWTGEVDIKEVEAIMALAQIRFGNKAMNKEYQHLSGVLYNKEGGAAACIHWEGVEHYCRRKFTLAPDAL